MADRPSINRMRAFCGFRSAAAMKPSAASSSSTSRAIAAAGAAGANHGHACGGGARQGGDGRVGRIAIPDASQHDALAHGRHEINHVGLQVRVRVHDAHAGQPDFSNNASENSLCVECVVALRE